jgi:hypothetical protein
MSLQNRQFRDNIQGIGYNVPPKEESQQLDESKLTLQEQKDPEMLMKMMSKMGGAPEGGMPKTPPMPKMGGGEGGTPKLDPEMIKKLMKMMQGGMMNAGTELPTDNQLAEGRLDFLKKNSDSGNFNAAGELMALIFNYIATIGIKDPPNQLEHPAGTPFVPVNPKGLPYESTQQPTGKQLTEGIWDDILRFFFPDDPETALWRLEQERKRKEKERLQHHYDNQPTQGPSAIPSKHI